MWVLVVAGEVPWALWGGGALDAWDEGRIRGRRDRGSKLEEHTLTLFLQLLAADHLLKGTELLLLSLPPLHLSHALPLGVQRSLPGLLLRQGLILLFLRV